MENYKKLLIIENGRIFIDVAYQGCGSGCRYCYVPSASERQHLASYEDLARIVEFLNSFDFTANQIISFCPNTEPFKSPESTERVLFLLEKLKEGCFYIQISTKEYIADALLDKLDMLAVKNRIFINVSMPILSMPEIEPNAASIEKRISNLERMQLYPHLNCGLYIKPCYKLAINNLEEYIEIINRTKPDYVCIGPAFDKRMETPCATLHHQKDAVKLIPAQKNLISEFSEKLRCSVQCPIIHSSICAIFQTTHCRCLLNLWHYDETLCHFCSLFHDIRRKPGKEQDQTTYI